MTFASPGADTPLDTARALARAGQSDAARQAFRQALTASPRDTALLMEFGVFEAQAGDRAAARKLLEKALKIAPDDPDVHINLGELARQGGAFALAERHYRRAMTLNPRDAEALYGLGNALAEQGRARDALPFLIQAHDLMPGDAEILNTLAIALEAEDYLDDAIAAYRKALDIAPDFHQARANLAVLLQDRDETEEAEREFARIPRKALPAEFLARHARALIALRRSGEALDVADAALAAEPGNVSALMARGTALQRLGDFDGAEASYRAALDANPALPQAYHKLATIRRLEPEAAERLGPLLADTALDANSRANAGFALYTLLDRADRPEDAFAALEEANALRASALPFDTERHRAQVERVMATFTSDFFAARADEGVQREGPVFVLGLPRSGTTLVEQILAGYDSVLALGERDDLPRIARTISGYPEQAGTFGSDWARETGEALLAQMFADRPDARFATNKSPGNYLFIGLISWLFPRARIVHCRRDPRDTGLSCFEQNFDQGVAFSYDLEAFAAVSRLHDRLMAHWHAHAPVAIHTVDYEALVADPEPHARALVDHVGLDWTPDCLRPQDVDRPIDTASVWQARQPINTRSIGKWKRYERHLGPLLQLAGERA
ncbi:sulfotransferase [Kaustia mangrovi]|uniref:Sulfotransferase n=1 Tax=Kaustia mangrovi TaxID=2593653 RepID=A0A7S8HB54_9HYPH|nr:tetratricopeptide repeat-containing sulfotransferase family protein [Kaustia mangrovi]QPC41803.1 sulfotransferase [Kaustia mangrovi]